MPQAQAPTQRKSIYRVHPGLRMTERWVAALQDRTGRSLEQWLALVKKSGLRTEKERQAWLAAKYNLSASAASWIAERTEVAESRIRSGP